MCPGLSLTPNQFRDVVFREAHCDHNWNMLKLEDTDRYIQDAGIIILVTVLKFKGL